MFPVSKLELQVPIRMTTVHVWNNISYCMKVTTKMDTAPTGWEEGIERERRKGGDGASHRLAQGDYSEVRKSWTMEMLHAKVSTILQKR